MSPRFCIFMVSALGAASLAATAKPADIPDYQLGLDALAGHLWEVAAARFESALTTPELEPATRGVLLLRLAESRIRARQSEEALAILEKPELKDHPERPFWTAQALATAGRLQEAIDQLDASALAKGAPHRAEAHLTKAGLQHAIGDATGALATADALLSFSPGAVRTRLLKARILIDRQRPAEALKALPDPANLKPTEAAEATYLKATALLAEDRHRDAIELFTALIESPTSLTLIRHHSAILGLARARLSAGDSALAADGLLAFIQKNPRSPLIDAAFELLVSCLPEKPAPNDAILTRIREWVPAPPLDAPPLPGPDNGAASAWPLATVEKTPLAPQALFHLALGLRREGSADSRGAARRLLTRLRLEYPTHPLVPRALLETGRWDLEDGRREEALASFEALDQLGPASPPELRAQGLSLEGTARFREGNYQGASAVFERAAALLEADQRRIALLNAASSLLAAGHLGDFSDLEKDIADPDLAANLALERALYLSSIRSPEALPALRAFLTDHPDHPRLAAARLAAALSALDATPPDPAFARAQLTAIAPESLTTLSPSSLALAQIRLHDREGDWATAALTAADFLAAHPTDPHRAAILFEQGRASFQNKDYNAARLVLERLATEFPDSPQAPAALLLSARAAAEGATPQSQSESLTLFNRLIDSKSPFADVARLEKADILIDLSRFDEAIETLGRWFDGMKKDDPLLLSVGLLLGDALFASGEGRTEVLERTLGIYDRLLAELPAEAPARARILYQKGLTLERFGLSDSDSKALAAYMDVVQAAVKKPGGDWKSIELCGFRALLILEKAERWQAAKSLARTIASLKGPRSAEAEERATSIGLEHMIFDD